MKITFIYAYEIGEVWSTPMALINQFKKIGWEVEIISIGSNRTGYYHDNDLKKWISSNSNPDIVLFMDWGRFDSPWLDKSLKPKSFWIQESGDDPQNFERNFPKSNKFHATITPDHDSYLEYKRRGINAHWVTHFADTAVQYSIDTELEYVAVTTRGPGNSSFLDNLTRLGEGSIGNRNNMNATEHTLFLNKGMMVIQNSRWGEITRRIFEGMACGKLVITDRLSTNKKLSELFEEGKEIILYDNFEDCVSKINYYYENEDERRMIASNGYKKVISHFTQVQVVDKIILLRENYKK